VKEYKEDDSNSNMARKIDSINVQVMRKENPEIMNNPPDNRAESQNNSIMSSLSGSGLLNHIDDSNGENNERKIESLEVPIQA
jgi:hypothetical protein